MIMKIAYISQFAPDDRRASSGTNYKVVEQLGKMGDITWFPIRTPKIYRVFELASKVLAKICGRKIYFLYTKLGCNLFARNQRISIDELNKCDIIFAFFNATPFWTIATSKPIVYLTDATYPAMIDYYPPFCNLFNFNKKRGSILKNVYSINLHPFYVLLTGQGIPQLKTCIKVVTKCAA